MWKITLIKYSNFQSKVRNNFWKSQKFSRHLSAAEFRSSYTFAVHSNFALIWNLRFYEASLQFDPMNLNLWFWSPLNLLYSFLPWSQEKRKSFFSYDYILIEFSFNLLYCNWFQWGRKQTLESQKIRLVVDKIGLISTVCKLFKNYRMQSMFRIWSSILMQVNSSRSVDRWVRGRWVGGLVVVVAGSQGRWSVGRWSMVLINPYRIVVCKTQL